MANRFLSNITINDSYTFPSADGANGQVIGTDGAGNLSFVDQTTEALTLNVTVKNVSGGSLAKGTIVHASPSANPPSGNVVEVIAADYDDAAKMPAIGILNETLANEAEGEAIMFGAVSGIDTSSFSAGDELWVGDNGAFTNTKPATAGQLIQKIAVVIKSHASNGLIKVFGAGRTNDVPLPLYIDDANQRVGIGTATPGYQLETTGTIRSTGMSSAPVFGSGVELRYTADGAGSILAYNRTNGSLGYLPIRVEGDTIDLREEGSSVLYIDGGNVGINTTSPFTTGGTAKITSKLAGTNKVALSMGVSNTNMSYLRQFGNGIFQWQTYYNGSNTGEIHLQPYGGNVGIGTTSPGYKLSVNTDGDVYSADFYQANSGTDKYNAIRVRGAMTSAVGYYGIGGSTASNTSFRDAFVVGTQSSHSFNLATSDTARMTITSTGDVGIGTTSPTALLHIVSDSYENLNQVLIESTNDLSPTGPDLSLYRNSDSPADTDYLGALWFYGNNSAGEQLQYSGIYGRIVDTTDGTEDGSVLISNTVNGSLQTVVTVSGDDMTVVGDVTANHYFADTHFRSTDTAAILSTTGAGIVYLRPNGYNQTTGQAYLTSGGVFNVTDRVVTGGPGLITSGNGSKFVQLGDGRTDNNYAYIDLIGDTTYTDYGLRVMRTNGGPNTSSQIIHRGTGDLQLRTTEAAPIVFYTSGVERLKINPTGGINVSTNMTFGQGDRIIFPDNTSIPDDPTNEQVDYITFGSHGSISQVSGRGALMITSSDDSLILANGEVGRTFVNTNVNADAEGVVLLSDGQVDLYSDLQDGWDGAPTPWYRLRYSGNVLTTYDGNNTYTYWNSNDDATFSTVTGDSITTDLIKKKADGQGTNTYINLDDDAFYTSSPVNVLSIASISGMAFMTDTNSNGTNSEHFSFYTQGTTDATATKLFEINQGGNVGIVSGSLLMGGTTVIDSSRNLTNIGTISSGDITISKQSAIINMGYQGGPHGINFYDDGSGGNALRWGFYYRTSPETITFETGGTDAKFTLDTSGNLDITGDFEAVNGIFSGDLSVDGDTFRVDSTNNRVAVNGTISSSSRFRIYESDSNPDSSTQMLWLRGEYSGTKTAAGDHIKRGIYIDMDSSASGDTSDEHMLFGIQVDARNSGLADAVTGVYSYVESNVTTQSHSYLRGGYFNASSDISNASGNISEVRGIEGAANIQDVGSFNNAYAVYGRTEISSTRNANNGSTYGGFFEVEINNPNANSYGTMFGVRSTIDNNEGSVPSIGTSYLFYGDYQGTRAASNSWGVYVQGDKHYLEGKLGVGTTDPGTHALSVSGTGNFTGPVTITNNSPVLNLYSSTNGNGVSILFSDQASGSYAQQGNIKYVHVDGSSYGSDNAFILESNQTNLTVLADGKLMYKDGLYLKPSSGTGGGTLVIDSSRNITAANGTFVQGDFSGNVNITKNNVGIATSYGSFKIEATDAQIDLVSSSDAVWGSAINFVEGASTSANTDVWSIARQTTGGTGDSSLNFNFGTTNAHNNTTRVKFADDWSYFNGKVAIGQTSEPSYQLSVNGTAKFFNTVSIEKNGIALDIENSANSGADTGIRVRGARNGQDYATGNLTAYMLFSNHDDNTTPNDYDLAKIGAGMYDASDDTGFFQIQVNNGTSLVKALDIEKDRSAKFYGNLNVNNATGLGVAPDTSYSATVNDNMRFYNGANGLAYSPVEAGASAARYFLRFDYTNNASYPFLTNRTANGAVVIKTGTAAGGGENEHFRIEGGDGTVNAYFTDANLGVNTTNPSATLEVVTSDTTDVDIAQFSNSNEVWKAKFSLNSAAHGEMILRDASNNEDVVITSGGNSHINGALGVGNTGPSYTLDVTGNTRLNGLVGINATPSSSYQLNMRFDNTNANDDFRFAQRIDGNFSGADNTTSDREQGGIWLDIDSSADGDAANEHRLYGIYSDVRHTGFSDLVYSGYFRAENNNSTEKTSTLISVLGNAVHDSGVNGGVSQMIGVYGSSAVQDAGDVDNAYGGYFLADSSTTRTTNVGNLIGTRSEVQIDAPVALTYGDVYGVQSVIDNNEGGLPSGTNSYLFYGTYQGTRYADNVYGLYVQGDKHFLQNKVGIGTDSPDTALHISAASTNNQLTLERTTSSTGKYSIYTNTNNLYVRNVASNRYPLTILDSGNVLAGATVASFNSAQLEVHGILNLPYSSTNSNYIRQGNSAGYGYITPFANTGKFTFDTNYTAGGGYSFQYNGSEIVKINAQGDLTTRQTDAKYYSSISGTATAGGWYKIANVSDTANSTFHVFTYAHSSITFVASRGYHASNQSHINVLDHVYGANGSFANVAGVRIRQNGDVELKLNWSSGPTVQVQVAVSGSRKASLEGSLALSSSTSSVLDTVEVSGSYGMTRAAGNSLIGGSLGIGVSSPDHKLHIGSAYDDTIVLDDARSSSNTSTRYTSSIVWDAYYDQAARVALEHNDFNVGYRKLKLQVSGTTPGTYNDGIVLQQNGSVGINTENPEADFDVNGAIVSRGGTYDAGTDTNGNVGLVIQEDDYIYTEDGGTYLRKLIGKAGDIIQIGQSGTSLIDGVNFYSGTACNYKWHNNGSVAMVLNTTGLGVGVTSVTSGYKMEVGGTIKANGLHGSTSVYGTTYTARYQQYFGALQISLESSTNSASTIQLGNSGSTTHNNNVSITNGNLTVNGDGSFTGDVVAYSSSDKRLKDNVKPIENALNKVIAIGGYEFDWNDNQDTYEGHDVGVIAQEVEEVLPEVVETRKDGYKAVKYEKMVPLLIEAIKDQQKQIEELKALLKDGTK